MPHSKRQASLPPRMWQPIGDRAEARRGGSPTKGRQSGWRLRQSSWFLFVTDERSYTLFLRLRLPRCLPRRHFMAARFRFVGCTCPLLPQPIKRRETDQENDDKKDDKHPYGTILKIKESDVNIDGILFHATFGIHDAQSRGKFPRTAIDVRHFATIRCRPIAKIPFIPIAFVARGRENAEVVCRPANLFKRKELVRGCFRSRRGCRFPRTQEKRLSYGQPGERSRLEKSRR